MHVRILGSAAGGGFPQWNCQCENCVRMRRGEIRAQPRTQCSIAVSNDGRRWLLINASPDLLAHLRTLSSAESAPASSRTGPLDAIILTDGELDHCAGLLAIRETGPLALYSTVAVRDWIFGMNAAFAAICRPGRIEWRDLSVDGGAAVTEIEIRTASGEDTGLRAGATAVAAKIPRYVGGDGQEPAGAAIALRIRSADSAAALLYAPCARRIDEALLAAACRSACIMLDGTFWRDDEMAYRGVGTATATAMGHLPIGGPHGSLAAMRDLDGIRKIYTHINNTNPILDEDSAERRQLAEAGWEVAADGMTLEL
jgi:pyrroloquinoline quinone biosynthesis protein B